MKRKKKRSSILAEVVMMLETQLWAIDPPYPGLKDEATQQDPGLPFSPSQNPALVRVCLLKINVQKGISPSSGHLPISHFFQKALVKFGKLNDTG